MIKSKKGMMRIIWLFIIFFAILVLGFIGSILIGIASWGSNVVTPIAQDLGVIEGMNGASVNLSDSGRLTFGTLNTLIGMLPMLVGFAYLMLLVGSIVLVMSYRSTASPLLLGLFFAFAIVLILTAILVSNAYQDLYEGNDEIATQLQNQIMLSFLILNSPYVFGVVTFICGIFLFVGRQNEQYETIGGYA